MSLLSLPACGFSNRRPGVSGSGVGCEFKDLVSAQGFVRSPKFKVSARSSLHVIHGPVETWGGKCF